MNCNKRCEEILVMINALKNLFFYLQLELSREESRKDWKVGKVGRWKVYFLTFLSYYLSNYFLSSLHE